MDSFIKQAKGIVISLCDITGKFVEPWVAAGYSAVLVDPQHTHTHTVKGTKGHGDVLKVSAVIDGCFAQLGAYVRSGKVVFVAGFPPCTDVAISGARHFKKKLEKDPYCQAKASVVADQCRTIGAISGAPYFWENPVSIFSCVFGPADYIFNPHDYTGWEPSDNYTKKTCLRVGNGFVMPPAKRDATLGEPDDRIHRAPPSEQRGDIRSATPLGFARAVFASNRPDMLEAYGAAVA